jgi:hypothetical protein
MSKKVTMEVFRAGKQTDSAGNTKEWTKKDLDKIVSQFKELGEDVPATIGHNVKNKPAYGWFKSFYRKGKSLFGEMEDVVDEFGEMLKKKMFKNRSIALRPNLSIRHMAFLGAEPPAIKGMKDFAFSEADEFAEYEFEMSDEKRNAFRIESAFKSVGRLFQIVRDKKIEKDGLEKANDIIPQWDIDNLKDVELIKDDSSFNEPNNQGNQNPNNGGNTMDFKEQYDAEKAKNEKLTADLETANAKVSENAEYKEKFEASEKKVETLETEKATAIAEAKTKEYSEYAESLVKDEKILPSQKDSVVAMQRTLDGQESIDFAEADGSTSKKTPLDIYKLQIESNSVGTLFGEKFEGEATPQAAAEKEIESRVKAYEKEGFSYGESLKKVREDEPGLFQNLSFTEEKKD